MKPKRYLAAAIILPAVALLGWLLYRQAPIWATPVPRWIVSGGGQYFGSCQRAAQPAAYDAEPVEDTQAAAITREQALAIASRVIARRYGPFFVPPSRGPNLVRATFPDGRRRLAWYQVAVLDDGGATLLGKAAVVYLDALTGEPLVLIADVVVGDPYLACSLSLPSFTPSFFALTLLVVYLLVLAAVAGAVWLWRHVRAG